MKLKTYHVKTVEAAVRLAKIELGPDAVLVDSKNRDGAEEPGALAVTFAVGEGSATPPAREPAPPRHWKDFVPANAEGSASTAPAEPPRPPDPIAVEPAVEPAVAPAGAPAAPIGSATPDGSGAERELLLAEFGRLRCLVDELLASERSGIDSAFQPVFHHPALARLFVRLSGRGVSPGLAAQLAAELEPEAEAGAGFRRLWSMLRERIASRWTIHAEVPERGGALALVGEAGAGKTTLLAKLAVRYGPGQGRRLSLVSVDPLGVGAMDRLEAYAALLDEPLTAVADAAQLPAAIERLRSAARAPDLILVDTSGYGPAETDRARSLDQALRSCPQLKTHLVLNASVRREQMHRTLALSGPAVDRLAFTRLDQPSSAGALLDMNLRSSLPISFLSAGQRNPEDLVTAEADGLTTRLLGSAGAAAAA